MTPHQKEVGWFKEATHQKRLAPFRKHGQAPTRTQPSTHTACTNTAQHSQRNQLCQHGPTTSASNQHAHAQAPATAPPPCAEERKGPTPAPSKDSSGARLPAGVSLARPPPPSAPDTPAPADASAGDGRLNWKSGMRGRGRGGVGLLRLNSRGPANIRPGESTGAGSGRCRGVAGAGERGAVAGGDSRHADARQQAPTSRGVRGRVAAGHT
jgi:hypothetical protein